MHNLMKVYLSLFSVAKAYCNERRQNRATGFLSPPVILPINVDVTGTGKKIDIKTTIPTIFTLNGRNNTTRYDDVFMFLYRKNKEMKNLLIVASEEKQYTNFDNN